jgi:hypothetical protein
MIKLKFHSRTTEVYLSIFHALLYFNSRNLITLIQWEFGKLVPLNTVYS